MCSERWGTAVVKSKVKFDNSFDKRTSHASPVLQFAESHSLSQEQQWSIALVLFYSATILLCHAHAHHRTAVYDRRRGGIGVLMQQF